jgi:hypothetical protein
MMQTGIRFTQWRFAAQMQEKPPVGGFSVEMRKKLD